MLFGISTRFVYSIQLATVQLFTRLVLEYVGGLCVETLGRLVEALQVAGLQFAALKLAKVLS